MTDVGTYRLVMPGKVYAEFIDGSGVPTEESWPTPTWSRCGRGYRVAYETTPVQAMDIIDHVWTCATGFMSGADDDARAAGRVALRWYESEMPKLAQIIPDDPEVRRWIQSRAWS